jgi:DNA (cytosine-5)-methyltransferase 1
MKIVSLFSGAGGLDLGMIQAGHHVIWANDSDKSAAETYRKNIGNHIVCDDIKNISIDAIPKADVVIGGFPCQGFSLANMRRSVEDERNVLYKYFYEVVLKIQPKFFIAENVKGILSLDAGNVIKTITSDFENAGYYLSVNLVNMADYGVPQTRQRVVIIGQRKDLGSLLLLKIPKQTHSRKAESGLLPWVSIKEAIDKYGEPDEAAKFANHVASKYKVVVRDFTAHRKTDPNKPCPTILARGNGKGGVCAIPHYNGNRRLSIRESAAVQTFPDSFRFYGNLGSCYRQVGNAVPVLFSRLLGQELKKLEKVV